MSSTATTAAESQPAPAAGGKGSGGRRRRGPFALIGSLFGRIRRFVREVIAELRKVIWPTRRELFSYSTVVLIFVTFMVLLVFGMDAGFVRAVGWLFA